MLTWNRSSIDTAIVHQRLLRPRTWLNSATKRSTPAENTTVTDTSPAMRPWKSPASTQTPSSFRKSQSLLHRIMCYNPLPKVSCKDYTHQSKRSRHWEMAPLSLLHLADTRSFLSTSSRVVQEVRTMDGCKMPVVAKMPRSRRTTTFWARIIWTNSMLRGRFIKIWFLWSIALLLLITPLSRMLILVRLNPHWHSRASNSVPFPPFWIPKFRLKIGVS